MLNLINLAKSKSKEIITKELLVRAYESSIPEQELLEILSFLAAKSEISGRLFLTYGFDGKKSSSTLCDPESLLMAASVIKKNIANPNLSHIQKLKWLNSVFKILDHVPLNHEGLLSKKNIYSDALEALNSITDEIGQDTIESSSLHAFKNCHDFKILPITLLFWEGPISRAYLAMLYGYGYKPQRIINLVSSVNLSSDKKVAQWLPSSIRTAYCKYSQRMQAHYWPSQIIRNNFSIFEKFKQGVTDGFGIPENIFLDAYRKMSLNKYSDDVIDILIKGLNDPKLFELLSSERNDILFTGGGIVPKRLLDIQSFRFMHIHPGKLPEIRGADCTLWSHLLLNQPSATLFFMSSGIDDGDVIWGDYLPNCNFKFPKILIDNQKLYRAIYAFVDPWIRATILRKSLQLTNGFSSFNETTQCNNLSNNFHFMHQEIINSTFKKMLIKSA